MIGWHDGGTVDAERRELRPDVPFPRPAPAGMLRAATTNSRSRRERTVLHDDRLQRDALRLPSPSSLICNCYPPGSLDPFAGAVLQSRESLIRR